ncbi:hypothetical protein HYE39_02925 [Mycoplasmopsis bovis]|nr:hypothetical protein [Mycoplasmopsis bovis]QQH21142.1 hypothetical protein HYE39_02925 [Mycoplasmopsis bovis]
MKDFDNIENNECGELGEFLTYREIDMSFIPDLTLFINGLTLVVEEVLKKMTFKELKVK